VKKLKFLLLTAFIAAMAAPAAIAQMKHVAVVETEVDAASGAAANITAAEVRLVTAELRREAVKNLPPEKYNVMTSETVQAQGGAVLEECAEENCVIALGSKIGADYIVRGIISMLRARLTLTAEVYETDNGNLVASSVPIRAESVEDLVEKASPACAEMYVKFLSAQTARQKPRVTYTIAMSASPTDGGAVLRNPNQAEYAAGTVVNVMAAPTSGYIFTGWSGAVSDTANPITVTMDDNKTLIAKFSQVKQHEPAAAAEAKPPKTYEKSMSIGVGGVFANNTGGLTTGEFGGAQGETLIMPYSGGGAYLYLDLKYVEFVVGYSGGGGRWESKEARYLNDLPDVSHKDLNCGTFVKIPIAAGSKVKVFPLTGLEVSFVNSTTTIQGNEETALEMEINSYAILAMAGVGAAYNFSKYWCARAEALYGFGFYSYPEEILYKTEQMARIQLSDLVGMTPYHGLTVKAGIGLRF